MNKFVFSGISIFNNVESIILNFKQQNTDVSKIVINPHIPKFGQNHFRKFKSVDCKQLLL